MKNFYSIIFFLLAIFLHDQLNAQSCTPANANSYGNGGWIGHVYDHNGVGNPVSSPFTTYKGTTVELENFDRNYGTGKPTCATSADNFAIRYRMNRTFAPGNYTFTISGDDGMRLSIDGGSTWILSDWVDHGYRTVSVNLSMSGNYNLVLEYYEKGSDARVSFSLNELKPCSPTITTKNSLYINTFQFVGTLNDHASPNISGGTGYSDFTKLTPVVKQPQGSVLNIVAGASGSDGKPKSGYWKAWVDYNNDGVFTDSGPELVYTLTNFSTESLTFGFIIPPSTPPGLYRLRIRVHSGKVFSVCTSTSEGEVEDYLFEVVADCPAKINTAALVDAQRCGTGTVTLSASGTGTGIRWYANATGGTPLHTGQNFVTPILPENSRTTYYVAAFSGNCESVFRIPVTAIANPGPAVNFGSVTSFCSPSTSGQLVSASNGKRTDVILDEKFNTDLGKFQQVTGNGYTTVSNTAWINQPSGYIPPMPPYEGLAPALSSGYTGGNFVMTNTDFNRGVPVLNHLRLKDSEKLDTRNFDNLTLEFDLYYFTLITASTSDPENYFSVEYTINGSSWVNLQTIKTNQGNPNIWKKILLALPSEVLGKTTLQIRFSSYSFARSNMFQESIAAIDNVKIYGIKDESSQFSWSSSVSGILYESNCTTPLASTTVATICVKPTEAQLLTNAQFNITATATFSNGCPAVGTTVVKNDLKVYNTAPSSDWHLPANWKPGTGIPTADNCVIIKQPVTINSTTQGLAKNITVEPAGSLQINGSLKVTDFVRNNAGPTAVVVESDASLIQVNEGNNINTGTITVKRVVNVSAGRQQYNYLISPLEGQVLKTVYPNIEYVLYHNEANNFFYNSTGAYIKGRALAVKEPKLNALPDQKATSVTATFTGYPTNGAFTYNLVNSNPANINRGYNLVGNPYPSNMDLSQFYHINRLSGNISNSFNLWDNRANSQTVQMGDEYEGQAYAVFHATTPPGEGTGTMAYGDKDMAGTVRPTRYIKMGQGFMVKTRVNNQALIFNNTVRTDKDGSAYFGRTPGDSVNFDRFWLNMITPTSLRSDMAVVYFEGGTNGFSSDDAASLGGSDELYSRVDDRKVNINGRSIFTDEDVVPLGTRHFTTGEYRIELAGTDGIFSSAQPVYLKDKLTGAITNLSESAYSFAAEAGESTGRFEIVYKPGGTLATDAGVKESVVVYRDKNDFHIRSNKRNITGLQLFDSSGRLVYSAKPNAAETVIDANPLPNGVYFLRIERGFNVVSKKIIR